MIKISTTKKQEVVDITDLVTSEIGKKKLEQAVASITLLHTTCAVTTADLDPGTDLDLLDFFEAIAPKIDYRHPHDPAHTGSHMLSALIGTSITIPVSKGKLVLGTWQRVILIEFEGPRERELIINFMETI